MQYRTDRYGNKLSVLGYGCMRFTQGVTGIKLKKTEEEIMEAYHAGVNYYDTAYIYPGSEVALGKILEKNQIRDKVNIATKLPHYLIRKHEDMDKFFREELKRLRTDHVDYYLMHMLSDVKTWERLKKLGIEEWIAEKKESGEIRQVGFSYHGNSDMFCQLLDVYDWDFCQIQYNYLDEYAQAGVTGLKRANEKGIPVIIMEPLRGGKLVNQLPVGAQKLFKKFPVKRTPAQWAFLWLWNQPEVTVVLSGMNSLEMVRENVATAEGSSVGMLGKKEMLLYEKVVGKINEKMKVGCTGCRYCMPCPKNVDIPGIFAAYNRTASEGKLNGFVDYFVATSLRKDYCGAQNCVKCGKCEKHCPQGIEIRKELKNAGKCFEGPVYSVARKVTGKLMKY